MLHAFRGLRYPRGRGLHEPTKIAIRHNRRIALLRALVHLVPFGFALFEIILNWNVYYVGSSSYSTAAYQIIAKAHEILIQASIATIIFSATRRELALGKGLPFGLLFSGLQTSQISYLWSMEFWGAVRADFPHPLRKAALLSLVIGSIAVAVTSGPASAVLLIPRRQSWPAGSTHIWLNATTNQLWPTRQVSTFRQAAHPLMFGRIDGAFIPQACSTVGTDTSNGCPASEWYAIRDHLIIGKQAGPGFSSKLFDIKGSPSPCTVHGQATARSLYREVYADHDRPGPTPRVATTPHSVVADALAQVALLRESILVNVTADAGHGSPLSDQTSAAHKIASNYSQPYSSAVCFPDQFMVDSGFNHVAFPMLPFANRPNAATRDRAWNNTGNLRAPAEVSQVIEHPDYFYSQLLDPMDDIQAYRTRWIELPGDVFNGSSIGAAILLPRSEQDPVQEVVLCNIAAGWGRSSLVASSNSKVSGGGMISTFQEGQNLKAVTLPISRGINPEAQPTTDQFGNAFHYLDFPRRLINISASWAQYIDPLIQGRNTSLLDMLIQEAKIQGEQPTSIPETIVMLFVNGLARTAWGSTLQGEVKSIEPNGEGDLDGNYWIKGKGDVIDVDPTESQNWVTFRVDSTLDGYAYNVMTTPPKIAIAILTAYVLLVVGHTLYSGITGKCTHIPRISPPSLGNDMYGLDRGFGGFVGDRMASDHSISLNASVSVCIKPVANNEGWTSQ